MKRSEIDVVIRQVTPYVNKFKFICQVYLLVLIKSDSRMSARNGRSAVFFLGYKKYISPQH